MINVISITQGQFLRPSYNGEIMSILVTGGAGYIGSHTVLSLLENGYSVIVLDNLSNSSIESLNRVESLTNKKPKVYIGDIRDKNILQKIFTENKVTDVIHFAGLKSVSESNKKPLEYYNNNVTGTLVLLEEMINNGVYNFIFSSSATVYGKPEKVPLTESCRIGGTTNPYGYSKLAVENILSDLVKSSSELNVTCLRYFNPVGAHASGAIGESPSGVPNNVMPYISGVAVGKYETLNIFGSDYETEDGTGVRDYIHVMDLAEGHISALKKEWKQNSFRVYNLGTGNGHSVLELVKKFQEVTGKTIRYQITHRRDGDIGECWSDPQAAKRDLGWSAKRDLRNMIEDTWNWQKKNPNGYN